MNEGLRLSENEIREIYSQVYSAHLSTIEMCFVEQLLDAQIAELFSKVSTEKLKEELEAWLRLFSGEAYAKGKRYIPINFEVKTREISELSQRYALSQVEQARKEERGRILDYVQDLLELSEKVKEPAIKVKLTTILQALQKEG